MIPNNYGERRYGASNNCTPVSTCLIMVLELHVWGPAFGLPSIDAQCLATIAYFTQTVPKTEWVLVASSDPAVCPTRQYKLSHKLSSQILGPY